MAYRKSYKDDMDRAVHGALPVTSHKKPTFFMTSEIGHWASIKDIQMHTGLRIGAIRNSLARLVRDELVLRVWDGNERYGRYVYAAKAA